MKISRVFLLGSAAVLVAVSVGQAGGGKPVDHKNDCSLFGAGFRYVPGADACVKVGGWVGAEAGRGSNSRTKWDALNGNASSQTTNNIVSGARGDITTDVRKMTDYGAVRAYFSVGNKPQ